MLQDGFNYGHHKAAQQIMIIYIRKKSAALYLLNQSPSAGSSWEGGYKQADDPEKYESFNSSQQSARYFVNPGKDWQSGYQIQPDRKNVKRSEDNHE